MNKTIGEYKLIDSGKTIGDSFVTGCKIYKTKYDDLFLSEIDTKSGEDVRPKGILCILNKHGRTIGYISKEYLKNSADMNRFIALYNYLLNNRIESENYKVPRKHINIKNELERN